MRFDKTKCQQNKLKNLSYPVGEGLAPPGVISTVMSVAVTVDIVFYICYFLLFEKKVTKESKIKGEDGSH